MFRLPTCVVCSVVLLCCFNSIDSPFEQKPFDTFLIFFLNNFK